MRERLKSTSDGASSPNRPTDDRVMRAQLALGMAHREFGAALGTSERTSLRSASGASSMGLPNRRRLAVLVYPRDPALAQSNAAACSETLETLGNVAPAPPPAEAPSLQPRFVAADALGVAPNAARAARLATARARVHCGGDRECALGPLVCL